MTEVRAVWQVLRQGMPLPKFLYIGPEVPYQREAALHSGALAAGHEALVHYRSARQALCSGQEFSGVQTPPDELWGVHQILDAAAQGCTWHSKLSDAYSALAVTSGLGQTLCSCWDFSGVQSAPA